MEKLDKLSDYEYIELFDTSSDIGTAFSWVALIWGGLGAITLGLLFLMRDWSKPFEPTLSGWIVIVTIILCGIYWANRVRILLKAKKKFEALNARYESDKEKIELLYDMKWDSGFNYNGLYNYLKNAIYDRYERGVIDKYWYIDELFFGKLKSFIALKKSINNSVVGMDDETTKKYNEIKQILDKSAARYYDSMLNYQQNQNKTLVEVTLNVFKEVGI